MDKKFIMLDVEVYPGRVMVGLLNTKGEHIILDGIDEIKRKFGPIYKNPNHMWVNFNGFGYDLPLIEAILCGSVDPYIVSKSIIGSDNRNPSWAKNSVDLLILLPKIAKCSLKEIGHRLGYPILENLPYPYDKELTDEEWEHVKAYNLHDLKITKMLWDKLRPEYEARVALAESYSFHTLWSGAPGLAKKVFKLNEVEMVDEVFEPKGLGKITQTDLYQETYQVLKDVNLTTLDKLEGIVCLGKDKQLKGVNFDLSVGGFHSKPIPGVYKDIYEYDFTSLYPNICIENGIGGPVFCDILEKLLLTRMEYKRSGQKAKSDAYKLLINSITGCFRDEYAKDSVYSIYSSLSMLMAGQFNILDLIERLPEGEVILSNTDSIWCRNRLPQSFLDDVRNRTGLNLEEDHYDIAIIKDVNSVCCVKDGKIVKRKKEFLEPVYTHNVKFPILQKSVLAFILEGIKIETSINKGKAVDYMMFCKGNKNTTLLCDGEEMADQKIRYYVSKTGVTIERQSEKSKSRVVADSPVTICMNYADFDLSNLNLEWYIDRAYRLLEAIGISS